MGKKNQGKQAKASQPGLSNSREGNVKLSPLKKSELNNLVEKLLRLTSTLSAPNSGTKIFNSHLEIDKLLRKIMNIEEEIYIKHPERTKETIDKLTSWALENGAKIEGVDVAEFENYGFGLNALTDVKEGDFMISIPRKLMMTTDLAKKSELEFLIRTDTLLMHMPNIILSLFLLVEKFKPSSFWEAYIKALPSSYTTVLYFKPNELEALKGSPIYEAALKQCKSIARQYGYLYNLFHGTKRRKYELNRKHTYGAESKEIEYAPHIEEPEENTEKSGDPASEILRDNFTYKQYRWAVSTVMTRQNLIPTTTPENPMILALIPYWDMGNHDNGKLTTDYNVEADQSEYYACRDFPSGQQVFMSYGARPNSDVFLHNGFVQENNENDGIRLKLGVSKSDPLAESRQALLKQLAVPHSGEFLLTHAPIDGKLLAFLRVFNMDKDHLEQWIENKNKFDLLHPDCAVDTSVEQRMWQFLSTRLKLLLAAYPSRLEEDEKQLEASLDLSECMKLAIQQRMSEKRILTKALTYVEDHLKQ